VVVVGAATDVLTDVLTLGTATEELTETEVLTEVLTAVFAEVLTEVLTFGAATEVAGTLTILVRVKVIMVVGTFEDTGRETVPRFVDADGTETEVRLVPTLLVDNMTLV